MVAEFGHLDPNEKVLKTLELIQKGYSKSEVAIALYDTANPKNRLGALRKLMKRHNYVWNDMEKTYVLLNNKQEQTTTNRVVPAPIRKGVSLKQQTRTMQNEQDTSTILTSEDVRALKELVVLYKSDLEGLRGSFASQAETSITEAVLDAPLAFTKFQGLLQGTTIQLHSEVWNSLNDFCNEHKVSKKVVVNEAIWDFLKKYGETE